jgi:DNA-binding PadR family transcriptional regulator
LNLLVREPLSGYDLAQRMKRPLGFFWQAQHSQIYPELAGLEEHGCILHQVVMQEEHPTKKVYTITETGRSMLKAWVTQPPAPPPERNELLLKTYAIWLADPALAVDLFRTQEQVHAERLELYEQILSNIERTSGGKPHYHEPRFGDYATVRMGVAYEREYVTWCRWMIEQLQQVPQSQHPLGAG